MSLQPHGQWPIRRSLQRKNSFNGTRSRRYFCRYHVSLEMRQLAPCCCFSASRAGAAATSSRLVKEGKKVRRTPGRAVDGLHHQSLAGTGAPHFSPASQNPRFPRVVRPFLGGSSSVQNGLVIVRTETSSPSWQRWWLPAMARKQASFMLILTG